MRQIENPQFSSIEPISISPGIDSCNPDFTEEVHADTLPVGVMVAFISVFEDKTPEQAISEVIERRRMDPLAMDDASAGLSILLEKGFVDKEFQQKVAAKLGIPFIYSDFRNLVVTTSLEEAGSSELKRSSGEKIQDRIVHAQREKASRRQQQRMKDYETNRTKGGGLAVEQVVFEASSRKTTKEFEKYYAAATDSRMKKKSPVTEIQ